MSNIVTVNSGSAINGSLKAGRVSISTDSSVTPSSGGKTWYNMINPAGGYTFISDPKIQGYNDGPPILYPSQTTLPSDILATINGLPDRMGSVAFDNVWDALAWVRSTGKYFPLNKTLSGGNVGSNSFVFLPSDLSSYSQSGSIAYNLGEITNGDLINSPEFNLDGWFDFSGTDDYIYFNNLTPIDVYSFEVVFKPHKTIAPNTAPNNADYSLIGINTTVTNANGINVYEWTSGMTNETVSIWENGRATGITDTVDKRFHHMVFNWNGSTYDIWLDGEKKSTINRSTGPAGLLSDTNGIVLGHNLAYNYYHSGSIADVKAHTSALTDDQILQNYYGAPIVTTNFPHRWDAGNIVSYNGSTPDKVYSLANGSNSGSLYNGLVSTLPYGGTWEYDGVDDRIVLNSQITPGNGNWTLTAWVKGRGAVVGNSNGGPIASSYGLSNAGNIVQYNYDGAWKSHTGNTTLSRSEWYMLTWVNYAGATAQDGTMKMYVNGVADSSTFNSYTTNGGPLDDIGHSVYLPSGQQWFNGNIANVQLNTGTAFTDDEVSQQYNAEYPRFKSSRDIPRESMALELDAHNPDSYLSGTTWNDLSGQGNNGTLNNGVEYTTDNGGVLDFDGTDDYISIPNSTSLQNTSNLTLEAWVKLDTNVGYYVGIIGKGTSDANEEYCILILPSTGKLYMDVGAGGGPYVNAGYAFALDTWYHIAGTHERVGGVSTIKVYVNGVYQPSTTNGSTLTPNSNTTSVTIGSRFSNGGSTWPGQIALARIYTRTLTHDEILNSYTSTAPRYRVQLPRTVNDSLALDVDFGNTTSYPREGITIYDRSGNGNNGTATNGPPWEFTNGGIFDFDGTDDYINFNSPSSLDFIYTDPFSLEIWINPDATSGFKHLIGKSFADYRLAQSGTGISFRLDANLITTQVGTLVAGEWTHIVATWDPITSTARVYQDGILQGSITNTAANWTSTSNSFQIGTSPGEAYYFDGKIALGGAYSKTLSNSEVLENYKSTRSRFGTDGIPTSGLTLHWDASNIDSYDGTSTTISDLSGNGNNGTLYNGVGFDGECGGALVFDGIDDFVYSSYTNLNLTATDCTIIGVSRYVSINQGTYLGGGRIINARGNNWLMGHWDRSAKKYYAQGWVSDSSGTEGMPDTSLHFYHTFNKPSTNSWSFYIDNVLDSGPNSNGSQGPNGFTIGKYGTSNGEYSNSKFYTLLVYSRILSDSEVTQIYTHYRNRFGLD
tara:strand:+ start:108 stop:3785 length:3678 start_codon:yes stop_codon:yes gene_type:complete